MAGGIDEALHDRINRKLHGHVFVNLSDCSIFKVPNPLREINEKAYEPLVISIGPYHRGKEHLKAMEEQKMNSLKLFLDRTEESSVERYVTALEGMEGEVRKFYSEPLDHTGGKELVEMMLLDGCFIIELVFHGNMKKRLTNFYLRKVARDLLLVENQLPFPVLSKLYSLSTLQLNNPDRITDAVISFFNRLMPAPLIFRGRPLSPDRVQHLLRFFHVLLCWYWRPPQLELLSAQEMSEECSTRKWQFIRSATELNEAGIKFQKSKYEELFDIRFQKQVMSIPTLKIDDDTESILRNLVAYEQCYKICDSVLIAEEDFFYADLFVNVRKHCKRKWNLWKANLWHNYFNTSWALISFLAAVFLLLLTAMQSIYSALTYHFQ